MQHTTKKKNNGRDDKYRELKREMKSHRIVVAACTFDPGDNTDVPADHQATYATVQKLGRRRVTEYGASLE